MPISLLAIKQWTIVFMAVLLLVLHCYKKLSRTFVTVITYYQLY